MKKVTVNGTITSHERYLYRGYLQLAALNMLDNRNVLRTLLWDPLEPEATRPLALVQDASLYCYGTDFNKNVTEVFDGQGTIAAAYDYSPYGTVAKTGGLIQPVQWSSEMNDEELSLVYYNYRYYNPADGRWINRDPIAEQGGWNLYGFIRNRCMDRCDYLGMQSVKVWLVERQEPQDDFSRSESGRGDFLWTTMWNWNIQGRANDNGVTAFAGAEETRFTTERLTEAAGVEFECDQKSGNIKVTEKRSGGTKSKGNVSVATAISSSESGKTASVEFSAGAAWKGNLSVNISATIISVSLSSNGNGTSARGTAKFKCICKEMEI